MGPELIILPLAALQWLISQRLCARLVVPFSHPETLGRAGEISVIIPARNEAANLPRLLGSIRALAVGPLEVIVVDDDSSDGTAEVAAAAGATVVRPQPLPEDWRGKTWACSQGVAAAKGRLLMFLDADCRFETDGLEAILDRYPGGAFAVAPYHAVEKPYEELSAFFNLIMVASTAPRGLFGQCLLVERSSYDLAGGYAAVKSDILENVNFGRHFRAAGVKTASMPGRGMLAFRMYPDGLKSLIDGWTKGFAAGAASTPRATLALISTWIGGLMLGIFGHSITPWVALVYLAFALQFAAMLRRIGNFSFWTALLYPLPLFFYLVVFVRSLGKAGKAATWKGRKLHGA